MDRQEGPDGRQEWVTAPGGLVTALKPLMHTHVGAWVGWVGAPDECPAPFDLDGMHLEPVNLSAADVRQFYEGFANSTVWPLYHDVIVSPEFHREWWERYQAVNRRFAEAAAPIAAPGATVWVHDYQLQLVPRLLRELRPDLRIGYFHHIPFPGLELFSQLPWRRPILEGLLGADLVGFQRPDDAENFVRACLTRAGVGQGRDGLLITGSGRRVIARAFPISIDAGGLAELADSSAVRQRAEQIRDNLGNPDKIVLGVDRLDYTKGIRHRIKAFGELLEDGTVDPADVVLVQVATPSRERVEEYQRLRDELELTVGRLSGDYATIQHAPLVYLHQTFDRAEMAAMFRAADVALVTPLRDGMNLVAKEYVACRTENTGVLVLSEFTGAANELTEAIICNPHDIDGLKQDIVQALEMGPAEQERRMRALREQVLGHDVQRWAEEFLGTLAGTVPDGSGQLGPGRSGPRLPRQRPDQSGSGGPRSGGHGPGGPGPGGPGQSSRVADGEGPAQRAAGGSRAGRWRFWRRRG